MSVFNTILDRSFSKGALKGKMIFLGEKCFPSTLFFKFHIEKTQKNGTPRRQKVLKRVHLHNTKVNFYKILSRKKK